MFHEGRIFDRNLRRARRARFENFDLQVSSLFPMNASFSRDKKVEYSLAGVLGFCGFRAEVVIECGREDAL